MLAYLKTKTKTKNEPFWPVVSFGGHVPDADDVPKKANAMTSVAKTLKFDIIERRILFAGPKTLPGSSQAWPDQQNKSTHPYRYAAFR